MGKNFTAAQIISDLVKLYYLKESPRGKVCDYYWTLCASFDKLCTHPSSLIQSWLWAKYLTRKGIAVQLVFGWRLFRRSKLCCPAVWTRTSKGSRNPRNDTMIMRGKGKKAIFVEKVPNNYRAPPVHYGEELYFLGWEIYLIQLLKTDPPQGRLAILLEKLINIC